MDTKIKKIAIIGCGAVTVKKHIPVVIGNPDAELVALVDTNLSQLNSVASSLDVVACQDWHECEDLFDAAIVALPHHLHAEIGCELLAAGKHLLIEKPLALTSDDCDKLASTARERQVVLQVGLVRRYFSSYQYIKEIIASETLGQVKNFITTEGGVYNWPVNSTFFFEKNKSGGGVLFDVGAHVLDALYFWLGQLTLLKYRDDSKGGVETECELELASSNGTRGNVLLSRIRNLQPKTKIFFENGMVTIDHFGSGLELRIDGVSSILSGHVSKTDNEVEDIFDWQLQDWLKKIDIRSTSNITTSDSVEVIGLIEQCYKNRQPLHHGWEIFEMSDTNL